MVTTHLPCSSSGSGAEPIGDLHANVEEGGDCSNTRRPTRHKKVPLRYAADDPEMQVFRFQIFQAYCCASFNLYGRGGYFLILLMAFKKRVLVCIAQPMSFPLMFGDVVS